MSAALEREAAPQRTARSPGVWAAAWSRLKDDPVGLGALGVVLAFSPHAIYDTYKHVPEAWGMSPVTDLNVGGLEMMLEQSLVLVVVFAIAFNRMLERSEREQQRRERLEARP